MAVTCPAIADTQFLSSVLAHVDCQAQNLGESGYQAMSLSGGTMGPLLSGAFTIFIAIVGYRLVLGETPTLRDGVLAAIKIGVVLVLATSWPAFQTLVYNTTMHAPAELAANIGAPSGLPGASGGLVPRLQQIDDELAELTIIGAGRPSQTNVAMSATPPSTPAQADQQQRLRDLAERTPWDPKHDVSLLGSARTLFLSSTIASFAGVRLIAGLLLALAPLFAIFLLFDGTRGLFEGWLRGVVGAALGALGTAIVLGVELALVEPWLAAVIDLRRQDVATPAAPVELLVLSIVFALTLLAVLVAVAKVAAGFRFPPIVRGWHGELAARLGGSLVQSETQRAQSSASDERGRALAIADAVAATQRREHGASAFSVRGLGVNMTTAGASRDARGGGTGLSDAAPLAQSFRRRVRSRVSAGANRRDSAT